MEALAAPKQSPKMPGKYREVLIWPDARLSKPCESYEAVTDEVRSLLDDMAFTMLHCQGAGLAAPQVGVNRRAVVLKVKRLKEPEPGTFRLADMKIGPTEEIVYLVNPEVTFASPEMEAAMDACLSLPGVSVVTQRPKVVRVRALGYDGQPFEIGGDGLLAVALMHEIDHLNGIMVTDSLSRLRHDMLSRKFAKKKKRGFRYKTPTEVRGAKA